MQRAGRTLYLFGLVVWLALFVQPACAWAAEDRLLATSHGGHVWFVMPAGTPAGEFDLCHQSIEMGSGYYKAQLRLPRLPQAMVSWNERLWLVFPTNPQSLELRYEVFTAKVEKNAALGVYFIVPAGSMDIAPPLPGQWDLESLVATNEGPLALLMPRTRGASRREDVSSDEISATQPSINEPRLMFLPGEGWRDIKLPAGFTGQTRSVLVPSDADGLNITLLEVATGPTAIRYDSCQQDDQQVWTQTAFAGDVRHVRDRTTVLSQPAVVIEAPGGGGGGTALELALVRASSLLPVATIPTPAVPWAMLSTGTSFMLLEVRSGILQVRLIEPLTGHATEPQPLVVQPLTTGRIWQVSLLLAVSVSGLLLVFLIRPAPSAPIAFEKGVQALPGHLRLAAAIIDLFPAALITMLVLRCSLADLLNIPLMTIDIERTFPYLLMVALTAAHTTFSELIWSTSLGKGILEARIVQANGAKPMPRQILLRSLVKLIVLVIPPLAMFALISPHMQGLDDLAAGTVVVHDDHDSPKPMNEE